jgi:hypothetical protein
MPVSGGEEIQIHPGPLHWNYDLVVVDNEIYFINTGGSFKFIDFASGNTKTLIDVGKRLGWGFTVSPDRRWILLSLADQGSEELMLVENFR